MRLSTVVELGGFAALVTAAFMWQTLAGVIALGVVLLLIGYAIDDNQAALKVSQITAPLGRRLAVRQGKRQSKNSE